MILLFAAICSEEERFISFVAVISKLSAVAVIFDFVNSTSFAIIFTSWAWIVELSPLILNTFNMKFFAVWNIEVFVSNVVSAVFAVIFFLRFVGEFSYVGIFKRHKNSKFARMDTLLYSPLCLFLSVCCAMAVLG